METEKILRMNEGDGEFSYANNSGYQRDVFALRNKPLIENAIKSLLSKDIIRPYQSFKMADIGCGVGAVPLELISLVLETVQTVSRDLKLVDDQVPEIQINLNDLPSNDFNSIFRNIAKLRHLIGVPSCFVMGAPGSFYGRLFPRNSLHLVHSNYALHWLSQVPPGIYNREGKSVNKGNIGSSKTSPPVVGEAYHAQFRQDFTYFLYCRSRELVHAGYIVLALKGYQFVEPGIVEVLCQALTRLVAKGLIEEQMLDSFDLPIYFPRKEEVESIVREEGSFTIEKLEEVVDKNAIAFKDKQEGAEILAKTLRAFSESMVSSHFGEEVCDALYDELNRVCLDHLEEWTDEAAEGQITIIVVLRKTAA